MSESKRRLVIAVEPSTGEPRIAQFTEDLRFAMGKDDEPSTRCPRCGQSVEDEDCEPDPRCEGCGEPMSPDAVCTSCFGCNGCCECEDES